MTEFSRSDNEANEKESLPWLVPPVLGEKPVGVDYGYLVFDESKRTAVMTECSLEEVKEKVASGEALEVVMPGFDRLAPPSIVEELWPAVQKRDKERRMRERNNSLVNAGIFGAITLYSFKSGDQGRQMILLMFVFFGILPLVQYLIGAARRQMFGEDTFEETRRRTLFSFWLGAGDVPVTRICVRLLIGVFVVQVLASAIGKGNLIGGIIQFAIFVGPETITAGALTKPLNGELWRLITCGVVHGGLLHVGFNLSALKAVGEILERFYGGAVLLVTFFVSVLAGSVASVILMPGSVSVGASGGILGLVGFLLVVGLRHRDALPADFAKSFIRSVLLMAAVGFLANKYIDNAAHAGGFLAGCVLALPLTGKVSDLGNFRPNQGLHLAAGVSILMLSGAIVVVVYRLVAQVW